MLQYCKKCLGRVDPGQQCGCPGFVYTPGDRVLLGEVPHSPQLSLTEQVIDRVFYGYEGFGNHVESLVFVGHTPVVFGRRVAKRLVSARGLAALARAYRV